MNARQKIFARAVFFVFACISIASAAFSLHGCATMRDHSAAVQLVASQATLRYIDNTASRDETAARVVRVCDLVLAKIVSNDVTVSDLAALALASIPETLSPADRALAVGIIGIASQELQLRIGEGTIVNADDIVSTRALVTSIRDAARLYLRE